MREIPPKPAPKVGVRFILGPTECTVTSVWKSKFGDWKVSFRDSAEGGGIISLESFNARFRINTLISRRPEEPLSKKP